MVLLRKTLLNTCLYVCSVGIDTGCASGVVFSNNTYQQSHTITLNHMLAPIYDYNHIITVIEGAHRADDQKWLDNLTNQSIIRDTESIEHEFILHVIGDTWTCRFNKTELF